MGSISYDIDPGGDVEIVLKNPNTQKVVPELDLRQPGKAASSKLTKELKGDPDSTKFDSTWLFDGPPTLGDLDKIPMGKEDAQKTPETTETTEIRMRVSSSHLIFASPIFKAMLQGPWVEGTASTSSIREISATDWNPQALAVVLNALHGRNQRVPKSISLKFFVDIATIVEYYQCEEALQFCAEVWYTNAYKSLETFCKKSIMWLYIAWMFSWPDLFSGMMKVALNHSTGLDSVKTKDLPVATILEKVDKIRQELIGRILAGIDELHETLSTEFGCPRNRSPGCSMTALGSLVRGKRELDRLDPPFASPFEGHSVASIIGIVRQFPRPRPSPVYRGDDACAYDYSTSHKCSVTSRLKPVLSGIEKDMEKTELGSIKD